MPSFILKTPSNVYNVQNVCHISRNGSIFEALRYQTHL